MNTLVNQYLNKMLLMEEKGCVTEALQLINKIMQTFPEYRKEILFEKAKLEYRNNMDKNALIDLIMTFNLSEDQEIYQLILEAYYVPNKFILQETYQRNLELLKHYPYYMDIFEEVPRLYFPIWNDDKMLIYVNSSKKHFHIFERNLSDELPQPDQTIMMINEMWISTILQYENLNHIKSSFTDGEFPLYLFYDEIRWEIFLQLENVQQLIDRKRIVFFAGVTSMKKYLYSDYVLLPNKFYFNGFENPYLPIINSIFAEIQKKAILGQQEIKEYYENHAETILKALKSGTPKILFFTSIFTTALQYHTRDCMQAAENLGCEVRLLIEPNNICRVKAYDIIKYLCDFKPDLIFCIDHFRAISSIIPKSIVFLTWIQDKLPQSTANKEIIHSLDSRNILLSMFISDLSGSQWGMNYKDVLKAPISANLQLYRSRHLTKDETETLSCDICIVANATDYEKEIEEIIEALPEEIKHDCRDVISVYLDLMQQEVFFEGKEENYQIINYIINQLGIHMPTEAYHYIAEQIYYVVYYTKYKTLVAQWIIDAGYKNIKLYGNEWSNNKKLKPFAQGTVNNGDELSKALAASKIAIGLHPHVSLPARAIESIASGTLYLAHNISQEVDTANAREYFEEGKEIIYYYSREDLLSKIDYFLTHETERKSIIEAGQKCIQQKLTYEKMFQRVFKEAAALIETREK